MKRGPKPTPAIMIIRMKRLPRRHRIAHLRALIPSNRHIRSAGKNWLHCCAMKCWRGPAKKRAQREPARLAPRIARAKGVTGTFKFHHLTERSGMARAKRNKPHHPAKVHDRRSRDLPRIAEAVEVDDPFGLEPGDKIVTLRSIRNDPLGRLHTHRQIDEAQYQGGRAFQSDWEKAERGPQAVDPTREYVDGGQRREPITEGRRRAVLRLNRAERELGADGSALVHEVLILDMTMEQIGQRREVRGQRWID